MLWESLLFSFCAKLLVFGVLAWLVIRAIGSCAQVASL